MSRADYKNLYNSTRWHNLRRAQLARRPFCQCPHCDGKFVKGQVVDHIEPHKGDTRLFFNPKNLQTLTKLCHDSMKQSAERGGRGFDRGCDIRGNVIGAEHWE